MRGTVNRWTERASSNAVRFDFPYAGGSRVYLRLQQNGAEQTRLVFWVTRGQFSCASDCAIALKLDDGDVMTLRTFAGDRPDVLFVGEHVFGADLLERLKSARRAMVELPFYREGERQFDFDLRGLRW